MTRSFTSAPNASTTRSPRWPAGARPVAGGTDLVVGARQGKAPLPEAIVAIDRIDGLRGEIVSRRARLVSARSSTHETIVADADRARAVHRARRCLGDRRLARDARAGHDRRQRHERLAGDGHRRARCCVSARRSTLRSAAGERTVALDELWTGPGTTVAAPSELLTECASPRRLPAPASCYVRLEYRRQMEIAVVGATAVVTRRRRRRQPMRGSHHRARADDPPGARGRGGAARAPTAAPRRSPPRRPPPRRRRRRSATSAARPTTAARWPRSSRRAGDRRRADARPRWAVPIPASPAMHGATEERPMKVTATLTVNGTGLPGRARPAREPAERGARGGRPHRLEGGLRRLRVRRLHDAARRQAR